MYIVVYEFGTYCLMLGAGLAQWYSPGLRAGCSGGQSPGVTASRPALGPIQPPFQCVLRGSLGVKWLGHEADHSAPSSCEV
jgi:hypothetical protein